jgi:hypothetical protein
MEVSVTKLDFVTFLQAALWNTEAEISQAVSLNTPENLNWYTPKMNMLLTEILC